jgi:hypothetical protein
MVSLGGQLQLSRTLAKFVRLADVDDDDDDKEDKGRRKIQIEYIEEKSKRHITFSKRKAGIMKKVSFQSLTTSDDSSWQEARQPVAPAKRRPCWSEFYEVDLTFLLSRPTSYRRSRELKAAFARSKADSSVSGTLHFFECSLRDAPC